MSGPTTTRTTTRRKRRHPTPSSLCGTGGSPASVYFCPYPYLDSPISPAKRARSFATSESIKTRSVEDRRTRGQRHINSPPREGRRNNASAVPSGRPPTLPQSTSSAPLPPRLTRGNAHPLLRSGKASNSQSRASRSRPQAKCTGWHGSPSRDCPLYPLPRLSPGNAGRSRWHRSPTCALPLLPNLSLLA